MRIVVLGLWLRCSLAVESSLDEVYADTLVEVEAVDKRGGDQCYAKQDGGDGDSDDRSGCPGVVHLRGGLMIVAAYVASISLASAL